MRNIKIEFEDLLISYRKAKVDSFYENGHVTAVDFANYEHNLFENLQNFLQKFNDGDREWFLTEKFIGNHRYALKKVDFETTSPKNENSAFMYYSNAERAWEKRVIRDIDYRIIGKHSVNFHILSALWLEKVGYKFDSKITGSSYGCRLKGIEKEASKEGNITINPRVLGHFKPYIHNYQNWQNNGLDAISKAFKEKKKVIALTTDLKKYYHRIDPEFLLNPEFHKLIGIKLSPLELELTKILIDSINAWSANVYNDKNTPNEFKYNKHSGVPMGLGASKVIANILLWDFDNQVEQEVRPLYYGRYVDDIFLVLEDVGNINSQEQFWSFLKKRINNLTKIDAENQEKKDAYYNPKGWTLELSYSPESLVEFSVDKEKYFFLEGDSGESFLTVLKESLYENSSEWNLPPDINNDIESFTEEVSKVTTDNQEAANGLRKSDGLSLQRLKFILYLKRLEVVVAHFSKDQWQKPFDSFMDLCIEHAITPETISTYTKYYPRVVALCVSVNKFDYVLKLNQKIEEAFTHLEDKYKNDKILILDAKSLLKDQIKESIFTSINLKTVESLENNNVFEFLNINNESLRDVVLRLIVTDLHRIPFKNFIINPDKSMHEGLFNHHINSIDEVIFKWGAFHNSIKHITSFCTVLKSNGHEYIKKRIPYAFLFFTRAFTLFELTYLIPAWHGDKEQDSKEFENFLKYCSLFNIDFKQSQINSELSICGSKIEKLKCISLKSGIEELDRTVAFTSIETDEKSWSAVVLNNNIEPDNTRVERLFKLVNDILRCKIYNRKRIHYVIFPELSIPRELISYISLLFLKKGISVIAGVEYEVTPNRDQDNLPHINRFVSNQLMYVLTVKGEFNQSHVVIKQEKVIPAFPEERELYDTGGALLRAQSDSKYIINHDGFYFGGLICNDFLDIDNRAIFKGLIDALVVVEWNKDTNTYNALVESTANDLHTFVMQVNNRKYGDTRLRIPYKEDYQRDVVRVKGGDLDYFVVATLPVNKLREFQLYHRSPEKPFKPTPTGYKMSDQRKSEFRWRSIFGK